MLNQRGEITGFSYQEEGDAINKRVLNRKRQSD